MTLIVENGVVIQCINRNVSFLSILLAYLKFTKNILIFNIQ